VVESQRLEFLGDAVLGFLVGEMIYRRGPNLAEGPMSRLRAALVQEATLAERARSLGIPEAVRLGKGEERSGGRRKASIQSDVYESVLAAVYLDGGIDAARHLVERQFGALLEREIGRGPEGPIEIEPERDPKTALQEWLQAREQPLPVYRSLGASGPDHARRFTVEVSVQGGVAARGEASSRRGAEARAAQAALARLRSRSGRGREAAPRGAAPGGPSVRQAKGERLSPGRRAKAGRRSSGSRRARAR